MKKTLATIGLLIFASASFGNDGQHTGVGGNPSVPPPNPSGKALPTSSLSRGLQVFVTPGLLFILPTDLGTPDAADQQSASQGERQDSSKDSDAATSAQ